jgi:hypothetical protein
MIPEQGLNTTAPAFQMLIKTILYTIAVWFGQVQNPGTIIVVLLFAFGCGI